MRLVIALAVAMAALAAIPAGASAAAYKAPHGKVLWGGQGGYDASDIRNFATQSGKHPAVYNFFISWNSSDSALHWLSFRFAYARAEKSAVMLSVSPEEIRLTPRDIAQGDGDAFLIGLNRLIADSGVVTYLRPLSEMNNGNNPYSPYDLMGRSRGKAYSVRQFIRAWRRIALIVRGGPYALINRKLRRLGLPPVRTAEDLPRAAVALMWVPLSFGNPEIAKNHPRFFWPGARYVDWVGTTWYSLYRASSAMDRFYRYPLWRRKPFAFAEWGIWGQDRPDFVRQFFKFLRSHRRALMAVYYQSALLKPEFRLSTHPMARAALRQALRWRRMTGVAPIL
ncbi:MAG TPA: hypothetical protein VJT68_02840 [Thermoleophilaceae bacterium]|nr:hypothetical protein [Thermoleophilaceae bacterium]